MGLSYRTIEIADYAKVDTPSDRGQRPELRWLEIASLVIDETYQREITNVGRKNVRRIAWEFNWSMFSPLIVAPVGVGKYAIIDGQHRATAAALCGESSVPCAIIECERGEQARAFRAINGNTTRLHSLHVFHAGVLAGERNAVEISRVCAESGVSILRYPVPTSKHRPGETLACRTIGKLLAKFGDACVAATLTAMRQSGDGNAGLFTHGIIFGCCEVLADHPEWRKNRTALIAAFDEIDLGTTWDDAAAAAARLRGTSALNQFESRLVGELTKIFRGKQ